MITASQGEGLVADQCRAELAKRPGLTSYEQFVWDSFALLNTERATGMAMGLIPRSKIVDFTRETEMPRSMAEAFVEEIMMLDSILVSRKNQQAANRNK